MTRNCVIEMMENALVALKELDEEIRVLGVIDTMLGLSIQVSASDFLPWLKKDNRIDTMEDVKYEPFINNNYRLSTKINGVEVFTILDKYEQLDWEEQSLEKLKVIQKCHKCGKEFPVVYYRNPIKKTWGYEYSEVEPPCECEGGFSPVNGPSLGEWAVEMGV